ncbi:MAG: hypothetical protein ACYDC6_07905 [Acidobacteriaceae bacterium]
MNDTEQQFRLRRFWGVAVFSLGIFWGLASLVYLPIAAVTSIQGSSWLEAGVLLTGGIVTLAASAGAFYRRRIASRLLLLVGPVLLAIAAGAQVLGRQSASGPINIVLLFLSGAVAFSLGLFGWTTERRSWPPLREKD